MFSTSLFKVVLTASAVAVVAFAAVPSAAQSGEVQNRVNHQQARINQGLKSGQLTHKEARRDERHLKSIEAQRNRDLARNGGHLTAAEKSHLNGRLNNNSGRVYNTKHNGNTQPGA
ncbi:MAG: hypothetical protein IAI50_05625 [Candidatus Eremiobacteraeota bacterium]|nr:hypothetical protein [Candidatus Eremiobacteraeota bacterium]